MHVFRFLEFGLKMPIRAPKIGDFGGGGLTHKRGSHINETQKGASLCEFTSFKLSCAKIRRQV